MRMDHIHMSLMGALAWRGGVTKLKDVGFEL